MALEHDQQHELMDCTDPVSLAKEIISVIDAVVGVHKKFNFTELMLFGQLLIQATELHCGGFVVRDNGLGQFIICQKHTSLLAMSE